VADDDKSRATSSTSSRRTMAPAARTPAGEDDVAVESVDDGRGWLDDMSDDELEKLQGAVNRARLRRDRTPREPSFGISQGEQDELERTGRTVSPFTGEKRGDWSHERRGAGRVGG
jgi:hypothetical protein